MLQPLHRRCLMPARMILVLILGMLVLPSCQLDQLGLSLRERAEQGDADAEFDLGLMYSKGEGVPQDYKEAARWFRAAAEQGDANAQHFLGLSYNRGEGVPQDFSEAVRWFRAAAEQGHPSAQFALGLQYWTGEVVPKDYIQAHMWLNLSASNTGYESAAKTRDITARQMTAEQIAEAQRLAREWKPKSGSQ